MESGVTVSPGKIWRISGLKRTTTVNAHIVWGYGKRAELFTIGGIAGRMNADLYADTAARAGAAFGTIAAPRGNLLLAHDGDAGSEILGGALPMAHAAWVPRCFRREPQLAEVYLYPRDKNMQSCGYIRQVQEGVYSIALLGSREVSERAAEKNSMILSDRGEFCGRPDLCRRSKSPDIHGTIWNL